MEQTINILTERERQLEDIEQAIRETKYPPLNGGPTIQDLAELLKGAAATIEELGDQIDEMDETAERCDDLQDAIDDAVDKLDDEILDIKGIIAEYDQYMGVCLRKAMERVNDTLMEIRSDLRRA
jgi:ABC-type transporter Mla subunit MlaD